MRFQDFRKPLAIVFDGFGFTEPHSSFPYAGFNLLFYRNARLLETHIRASGLCYCGSIVGHGHFASGHVWGRQAAGFCLALVVLASCAEPFAQAQGQQGSEEIVTSLSGGRVILQVAKDVIFFAAIDQPVEPGAPPPRVVDLDGRHVAVLFGASEWRSLADPKPIRMDRGFHRVSAGTASRGDYNGEADPDLEMMGVAFLERLRPLAAQLQRKVDYPTDTPFFEMVVIGYGPRDYGPEAWTVEYRITQEMLSTREDFWQTRILRPKFTQIYPPEKHAPKTLVETGFPADTH